MRMAKKLTSTKRAGTESRKVQKNIGTLEKIYQEYLTPISPEQWSTISDLSQPSMLKQVPTRTAYSSIGAMDA